jgi:hypothetical protein
MPDRDLLKIIWVKVEVYKFQSAEGSLNQHIKLKHPEYFKEKGLQIRSNDISQAENKEQNY